MSGGCNSPNCQSHTVYIYIIYYTTDVLSYADVLTIVKSSSGSSGQFYTSCKTTLHVV